MVGREREKVVGRERCEDIEKDILVLILTDRVKGCETERDGYI